MMTIEQLEAFTKCYVALIQNWNKIREPADGSYSGIQFKECVEQVYNRITGADYRPADDN